MAGTNGIVVYEIIDNGNVLNGLFIIDPKNPEMRMEVAIKRPGSDVNPLIGEYDFTYWDGKCIFTGVMEIKLLKTGIYSLEQNVNSQPNNPWFKGTGMKSGQNHISFAYWD